MNHPVYLSTFIGREKELAEIEALLRGQSIRLLTLTGPGGCGKTRLVYEVLSDISELFEDGIVWIDLVGLSDPGALFQEIASTLEVRPAPGQTLRAALTAALQQRETLLMLDNCEHLLDASAQLVDHLLRACPQLHVLVTSRQKLGVEGEQVWRVPPLSYPRADSSHPDLLTHYDAIRLFLARAQLVDPEFEASEHNASALAKIAQLLEGMPLAIELAAARVNELDVPHMAERLGDQLSFLAARGHTPVSRHQSMRETIRWSFELLSNAEKTLFRRLGVFSGGFSLQAVEAVCSESPLAAGQILDLLGNLIDTSLVIRMSGQQSEPRYRQLESIRQYAAEKLREAGEESLIGDRHLRYFSRLSREAEPYLLGPGQKDWTEKIERDYDNLQTALSWSIHKAHEDERFVPEAARTMNSLYWFWNYSGRHEEARGWYAKVLELPGLDRTSSGYADLLHHLATFVWLLGNYPEAQNQLQDCIEIAGLANHPQRVGHAKLMLGIMSLHQGQTEQSARLLRESERLLSTVDDKRGLVITYANLGGLFQTVGDLDAAQVYAEKAVRNARATRDLWGLGLSLSGLADLLYRRGDVKRAFALMEEALALIQSSGQRWLEAEALWRLADMAQGQGDLAAAKQRLEECYALSQETGALEWQLSALESLGFLCLKKENNRQAAGHFAELLRLTGGQRYQHILVRSFLGIIQLAIASEQWRQARALWGAYQSLKETSRLSSLETESFVLQLLQPHLQSVAPSQAEPAGKLYSVADATGLAMEITRGFEQRIEVVPSEFRLRLLGLGPTEVYLNGRMLVASDWTFAKPKELLYYLSSNGPRKKEQIGLAFWPDASPVQLRMSLRATLYHLRRALGERRWILYEDGYYKFNRTMDYWYDVEAFENGIEAAEKNVDGARDVTIEILETAVGLYRGEFLSDLANDEWGALRREELRDAYLKAMTLLGGLLVGNGAYDRALEIYRKLLSNDILMEEVHRELMRCYALKGERVLALRQYQSLVDILQDELGVPPSPQTTALYQSLQQNTNG